MEDTEVLPLVGIGRVCVPALAVGIRTGVDVEPSPLREHNEADDREHDHDDDRQDHRPDGRLHLLQNCRTRRRVLEDVLNQDGQERYREIHVIPPQGAWCVLSLGRTSRIRNKRGRNYIKRGL